MQNIVFVGDSYCAHSKHNPRDVTSPMQFHTDIKTWNDQLAQRLGKNPIQHGYGGGSWWYAYRQLREWQKQNPEAWTQTDSMVICIGQRALPKITDMEMLRSHWHGTHSHQGGIWTEEAFDVWALEKFTEEIIEWSKTRKIIVFFNFRHECWIIEKLKDHMPVCFTPLMYFTSAETGQPPGMVAYCEGHVNHLNEHNNIMLAKHIHSQFLRYKPGIFQIATDMFDFKTPQFFNQWITEYRQILEEVYNNKI